MKKHIAFLFTRSLLLTLAMVSLVGAEDTPQLQQINHSILSPNSEQIVLKLSGSYSPKTFTLKDQSPRVVLDFADMTQGKGVRNLLTTDGPLLKGVRVGVHREGDPKTRVVVDLKSLKGVNYTQQFDEKTSTLTLRFTGPEKPEAKESAKQVPAPPEKPTKAEVTETAPPPATLPATTAEAAKPVPTPPPAAEQPVAPPVAQETVPPPPPARETTAGKETKGGKKTEKTTPATPTAETKAGTTATADKAVSPPPPPAATTPTEPQMPAVMTPPPPAAAAPTPPAPATKEPAPPVAKETKEHKEAKGVNKEEGKKAEEKLAATKEQAASDEAKPAPAGPTPAAVKQPADLTPPALATAANSEPELESIKFDPSSPKGEMIMFKLNGFHPPAVHGVEEGIPRVICDFNNTKLGAATKKQIKANGQHVKVIRTSVTKKPEKVRVVIDLEPNRSYDLQQVFFKDDNLFVIIVNTIGK